MPLVEPPNFIKGRILLGREPLGAVLALHQLTHRRHCVIQPHPVERLGPLERVLALAIGGGQFRIRLLNLFCPPIEAQIDRAPTQMLGKLVVLRFSLLPTRRDRGNATVDPLIRHHAAENRAQALRAKQNNRSHARTL